MPLSEAPSHVAGENAGSEGPSTSRAERRPAAGAGWAQGGQGHVKGMLVKGCRCCFPPDTMFEDACEKIVALGLCTSINAQKFVRLCGGGSGTMQLSKSKFKVAVKLGKNGLLTTEQVQQMQKCVDEAYAEILGLGAEEDALQGGDQASQALPSA